MNARYIRIDAPDQQMEHWLHNKYCHEKLYLDICNASVPFHNRPKGKELLEDESITYVSVRAIDRLGSNLLDILTTLRHFDNNGIILKVDDLGLESLVVGKPDPTFKLIIGVLANIAEMERKNMQERQREGIERAKAQGVYKGRAKGSKKSKEEILAQYSHVIKRLREGHTLRNTSRLCDVSIGTVQKVKALIK
ncbi:recombinase family protein [Ulvibacterium sp.]|uniref:recombinase family protein n=1 Tax=Ulvibacterium sp. TaxID=2665914 RepID=UPI002614BC7B|nr:recombinase family protein [Ulvibacterium sp.]